MTVWVGLSLSAVAMFTAAGMIALSRGEIWQEVLSAVIVNALRASQVGGAVVRSKNGDYFVGKI